MALTYLKSKGHKQLLSDVDPTLWLHLLRSPHVHSVMVLNSCTLYHGLGGCSEDTGINGKIILKRGYEDVNISELIQDRS
jgi:hypothetical protein